MEKLAHAGYLLFSDYTDAGFESDSELKEKLKTIGESSEYEEYLLSKGDEYSNLLITYNNYTNDKAFINWMKVTFFLLSRVGEWTFEDTMGLLKSEMDQLLEFIELENNGGEKPKLEIVPEEEDDNEDLGN